MRAELRSDCGACAALCCVALPFAASEDFAFDKAAGARCRHLRADCRCAVHDELVPRGLSGCAVFDCYGAGPQVTARYAGRPVTPELAAERDEVFRVLREVYELAWQLGEARRRFARELPRTLAEEAGALEDALDAIAQLPAADLGEVELRAVGAAARGWLARLGAALGGRRAVARRLAVVR